MMVTIIVIRIIVTIIIETIIPEHACYSIDAREIRGSIVLRPHMACIVSRAGELITPPQASEKKPIARAKTICTIL